MGTEKVASTQIRTVIDTNVFISAVLFKSEASKLVSFWKKRKIIFLISKDVFKEYIKVLTYPKFQLNEEEIKYILEEELLPYAETIKITSKINNIVEKDPTDNKFISLAVDGDAEYIISGDKHLLEIKRFKKIKIVSIKEFLSISQ